MTEDEKRIKTLEDNWQLYILQKNALRDKISELENDDKNLKQANKTQFLRIAQLDDQIEELEKKVNEQKSRMDRWKENDYNTTLKTRESILSLEEKLEGKLK